MSMNITGDYSQFYAGTEQLKSYGTGGGSLVPKDTLVKYEFKTTDEEGNRIIDPMTKEEALRTMKEISSQYGENVIVEFSGNGLDALAQSIWEQAKNRSWEQSEEYQADQARKQALMEQSIVHLENTHRLIIPNIQTNKTLYDSLENAPEHIVKAANGIIKNYLLPHDVSGMTEEQRREAISFGLEESRYLAENYLDEQGFFDLRLLSTARKRLYIRHGNHCKIRHERDCIRGWPGHIPHRERSPGRRTG